MIQLFDVVKRTCGYLGNPQQRPMVHGRHEEIIHRATYDERMIKHAWTLRKPNNPKPNEWLASEL